MTGGAGDETGHDADGVPEDGQGAAADGVSGAAPAGAADEPLFSYGTLRLPAVQRARFGRLVVGVADAIAGWRLTTVAIDDPAVVALSGAAAHPMLVATGDARDHVAGHVLWLTAAELAAADAYEVAAYRRVRTPLASGGTAWAYVAA